MHRLRRASLCLILAAFAFAANVPQQAAAQPPQKSSCCEQMKPNDQEHCRKEAPKQLPDQSCCASCILGLSLLISEATPFIPRLSEENFYPPYSADAHVRRSQPPVPPPRLAFT